MGDMGEIFNAMRECSKKKRANNRQSSPEILKEHGIQFKTFNNGAHLVVYGRDGLIDFWPGTGKFITRSGEKGRGVFNLLTLCENN